MKKYERKEEREKKERKKKKENDNVDLESLRRASEEY